MDNQIGALNEKLAPVTSDHIAKALVMFLGNGLVYSPGIDAERAADIYAIAMRGIPVHGVRIATGKIIRGEYEINRSFIPKPPEFAAMARLESKMVRDDLVRLRETRATLAESAAPREKTNEEQMARIRSLHAMFKESYAVSKGNVDTGEFLSDEKVSYYEAILALKDAPNITEEQRAARREGEADVETNKPEANGTPHAA